jgi:hypothetical protein
MEAFSVLAALATAVQAVALIGLHLLPTGYDPVRDAVSDYGVGRRAMRLLRQLLAGLQAQRDRALRGLWTGWECCEYACHLRCPYGIGRHAILAD